MTPVPPLELILKDMGDEAQVIEFNPQAALQKAIFRVGYTPNSPEYEFLYTNDIGLTQNFVGQRAERLDDGDVKYFAVVENEWDYVFWTNGEAGTLAPVPDSPQT